jgi:hypothetical protein
VPEGGLIVCVGARHAAPLPEVKVIEAKKVNLHATLVKIKSGQLLFLG